MLKKRVIPVLLLSDKQMVKGKRFNEYRPTGKPVSAVRIYSAQDADELVFLDVDASKPDKTADFDSLVEIVSLAAEECFMPLSAGGGIYSLEQIRQLLLAGADKVVINSATITEPQFIRQAAEKFGNQCIVAGIDFKQTDDGPRVWINCGTEPTELEPVSHAIDMQERGAGEIFLNSIDNDGMMDGYDLEIIHTVSQAVSIPVIGCGGAGNFQHLHDLLHATEASAAACASLFHFGDNSPIRARSYLQNNGLQMRTLK